MLGVIVTAELMRRHPEASEGDLAWMRQQIVGREACARVAVDAGLPSAFVAAAPARHRDSASAMSEQTSVRAALVEALIGAAWEDLGHETTTQAVLAAFAPVIDGATLGQRDAKTALQERAAQDRREVHYEVVAREGPPHDRVFTTRVRVGGEDAGQGVGRSKQASEQAAARVALENYGRGR